MSAEEPTSDDAKFVGIEIGEIFAAGPAADWPELDQHIWLLLADGFYDNDGDARTSTRLMKALGVLNEVERALNKDYS